MAERLEEDTLYLAATRPALFAGVPLPVAGAFLMLAGFVIVILQNPLYELVMLPSVVRRAGGRLPRLQRGQRRLSLPPDGGARGRWRGLGRGIGQPQPDPGAGARAGHDLMPGDSGTSERSGEIYLPDVGHVADQAVLLRDGSVMAMGHVGGVAFELEEPEMRNARLRNLNTLFRNIADDNVNVCTHLIRVPARGRGIT